VWDAGPARIMPLSETERWQKTGLAT